MARSTASDPDPDAVFSVELRAVLTSAREIARRAGGSATEPVHLSCALLAPVEGPDGKSLPTLAADLLGHLDFNVVALEEALLADILRDQAPDGRARPAYSSAAKLTIAQAGALALSDGRDVEVTTAHLLMALVEGVEQGDVAPCLLTRRLSAADVSLPELSAKWGQMRRAVAGGAGPLATGSLDTHPGKPSVDFVTDLTAEARAGKLDPIIGRDDEIERVIRILSRRTKNNPVLLGDAGVGKSAVVEGLAQRIAEGNVPERLRHNRILAFSPAAIVAGTKYRGDFEARVLPFLRTVREDPEVILFIDELHAIVGAGTGGMNEAGDLSTLMKPALARGELRCIGTTTLDDYRRYIETDSALERRFAPVTVKEPSEAETLSILMGLTIRYGPFHGVNYPEATLEACVTLAGRHLSNRRFPDKAIDIMDEAGSRASLAGREEVTIGDILAAVAPMAGTTVEALAAEPVSGSLAARISTRVMGQPVAVTTAATIIESRRLALTERLAPLASFILIGPPGSGKSSLAKAIAEAEFEGTLITLDLTSYSDKYSISGLIGSPPGYVGFDEPARLVEPIRRRPAQVVLLEHADAAATEVRLLIADILRTGSLADTHGRTASFRDAVVILTVTDTSLTGSIGFRAADESPSATTIDEGRVRGLLGADLADLADAIIAFSPLSEETLEAIAESQLAEIRASLARRHNINLAVSPSVRKAIVARAGRTQGARPIRRAVEFLVEHPLSSAFSSPTRRSGRYLLDVESGKVVLRNGDEKEESPI